MRTPYVGELLLVALSIAGCASAAVSAKPGASGAPADLNGTWRGQYVSNDVVPVGTYSLNLQQTGSEVTGTASPGGPLEGLVTGSRLVYKLTSGRGSAGEVTVDGDNMTGFSPAGSRLTLKRVR